MDNRRKILYDLMQEIIDNVVTINKNTFLKNNLKNYPEYFTKDEILEYSKKMEVLEYINCISENKLQEKWVEKNSDIIIYFIKDIKEFFEVLKNKRKKFLEEIFRDCIASIENASKFCKFVGNSEYYFENYRHYFTEKEIKKYNELWLDLEIENAVILSNDKNKWGENYHLIIEGIRNMLVFLNGII